MKKIKISLIALLKISLLFFTFFLLFPSLQAKAVFSDTANINMGIKLELGTVNLAAEDTKIVDSVNFTDGDSVLVSSSTLINNGSLTGRLAYKIDVTKENGSGMTPDELKNTVITIEFGTVANKVEATASSLNADSFTFAKDISGNEVIVEPDSVGEVPVNINYKSSIPTKEEKLTIKVTFRLIQSNADDANAKMFSDEESLTNTVTLVPKVVEEESYWPDESTFVKSANGGYSYSLEKMKMVFSETQESINTETRQIKNLNKAILYIQLPDEPLKKTVVKNDGTKETKDTFIITYLKPTLSSANYSTGNEALVEESREINEEHNGIIITFNLKDEYLYSSADPNQSLNYSRKSSYALQLNISIDKYNDYGYYQYYDVASSYDRFFASRLVLNSDIPDKKTEYFQLPIELTTNEKLLSFKRLQIEENLYASIDDFKDVPLTNEKVDFKVTGENYEQVSYLLNNGGPFPIWLNSAHQFNGATLNVEITGDANNRLIISRKLILQKNLGLKESKATSTSIEKQESEQQVNVKKNEEPTQQIDSSVQDEQNPEAPVQEVAEEKPINEVDEVNDPLIEEIVELNDTVTEPIEETNQTVSEEKTSDEKINK